MVFCDKHRYWMLCSVPDPCGLYWNGFSGSGSIFIIWIPDPGPGQLKWRPKRKNLRFKFFIWKEHCLFCWRPNVFNMRQEDCNQGIYSKFRPKNVRILSDKWVFFTFFIKKKLGYQSGYGILFRFHIKCWIRICMEIKTDPKHWYCAHQ